MIQPSLKKNDKAAYIAIIFVSVIVFVAVTLLAKVKLDVALPFDAHVFALANAFINSVVALLLIAGLLAIKKGNPLLHKKLMMAAIILSVLFLVSYIAHHLLTDATKYGDVDGNGIVSDDEKASVSGTRGIYYFLLLTHIPLAGIILPFILFTAYRALIGEYLQHKRLAKYTWPVWLYVALSGVIIYIMISPYY